jgi:hypothetical protein
MPTDAWVISLLQGFTMLDLASEKIIFLTDAAKLLPRHRRGRPVSASTLWRWAMRGAHGVRLETARLPSGLVTSVEALQRFVQRLSNETGVTTGAEKAVNSRLDATQVEQELDGAGIRLAP